LTVDASVRRRSRRASVLSLFSSIVVQVLALGTLALRPLVEIDAPAPPELVLRIHPFVPVKPPPAPSPGTRAPSRSYDPTRLLAGLRTQVVIPSILDPDVGEFPMDAGGVPGGGVSFGIPDLPAEPIQEAERPKAAATPVVVGGDVRPPRKRSHVNPVYPPIAIAARVQGTVVLEAVIDAEGNVEDLRVRESIPLLDAAAMEAVLQWKYEPTRLNGRAVPVVMLVRVEFQLAS
jgi:protein TonB